MAENLTSQQLQAVNDRGGPLLVSAAAGSGKTKVLVERLLSYLTDPADPANIDDFLIITYTKAAAAELRGKIAARLSEQIAREPNNMHLHRQMQRLYLAKISTVHAFCTDLLRDYFYRLDLSADFRVAEENECLELQLAVIDRLLDKAYENIAQDQDFRAFVDSQGLGRDDRQIPIVLLQVYNTSRCNLNPQGWLDWCLSVNATEGFQDASETIWGKYLIDDLHLTLQRHIDALRSCVQAAADAQNMEKPAALLADTVDQLERLCSYDRWDDIIAHMHIDYGRLVFPKKNTDETMVNRIKAVRVACKKGLEKKLKRFCDSSERILSDIKDCAAATRGLVSLTEAFASAYAKLKKDKRIMDFSDLEHYTLDLLVGRHRSGPTAIASEIGQRYREVMVDEYQDSNTVQDAIFGAITHTRKNCFMVGDVKQSIYQFRLADPGIFLEKYNSFNSPAEAAAQEGRKVLLSNNFRSATSVIEAVNHVFSCCMTKEVGDLDYGEDEALYEGCPHESIDEAEVELHGITVREDSYAEEAVYVTSRICQLLDGTHFVRSKEGVKPIVADDIVILLRSPGSSGAAFAKELEKSGIRCCFGGAVDVLCTEEVQVLRALLQVIDNPMQDIPLTTVLMSRVFGFTADDMAHFRGAQKGRRLYSALCMSELPRARAFVESLSMLRQKARMLDASGLLQTIYAETKFDSIYSAMPDGELRVENLHIFGQLLNSFESSGGRTLSNFLRHLEALDQKGVPGSVEQHIPGAVTIMSIHKSKGLEFPVVFLCGLARKFNRESINQQILCDRELGLGLSCVDMQNRIRYPSIAKRAIAVKMLRQSISEELRVLYVAMTRPKDRLIMTYASGNLEKELFELVGRMDNSDPKLLTSDVECPGKWVLYSALQRGEAGSLFALGGYPTRSKMMDIPWRIVVDEAPDVIGAGASDAQVPSVAVTETQLEKLKVYMGYSYPYASATKIPSKQTATQIKGREKDIEAAENTGSTPTAPFSWRKPSFVAKRLDGRDFGNAVHRAMQYIDYAACADIDGVADELDRLVFDGYLSKEERALIDHDALYRFFATPVGLKLSSGVEVIREFKFSILDSAAKYADCNADEMVLLQGVVDCAILEEDGIVVLDFKTDRDDGKTAKQKAEKYISQVSAYADALSRIFEKPVKSALLYFFSIGEFYAVF